MSPVSAKARWTTSRGRDARRPRRIVALKSGRRRSRDAAGSTGIPFPGDVRPTGPDGPFGDEQRGWLGRHECACAAENHGSLRGGDCSAGTCACSLGDSSKEAVRRVNGAKGCAPQGAQSIPSVRGFGHQQVTRTSYGTGRPWTRSNGRELPAGVRPSGAHPPRVAQTRTQTRTLGCGERLDARGRTLLASHGRTSSIRASDHPP